MASKYDQPPGYIQSPPQAHSQPHSGGEAAGYYSGPPPQQYGSPAPYNQGYNQSPVPYGQQQQYGPPQPYYQQPMQYGPQPGYPPQGYYQDDRGYGSRGGGAGGLCAGILGACACLACFDLCLF